MEVKFEEEKLLFLYPRPELKLVGLAEALTVFWCATPWLIVGQDDKILLDAIIFNKYIEYFN